MAVVSHPKMDVSYLGLAELERLATRCEVEVADGLGCQELRAILGAALGQEQSLSSSTIRPGAWANPAWSRVEASFLTASAAKAVVLTEDPDRSRGGQSTKLLRMAHSIEGRAPSGDLVTIQAGDVLVEINGRSFARVETDEGLAVQVVERLTDLNDDSAVLAFAVKPPEIELPPPPVAWQRWAVPEPTPLAERDQPIDDEPQLETAAPLERAAPDIETGVAPVATQQVVRTPSPPKKPPHHHKEMTTPPPKMTTTPPPKMTTHTRHAPRTAQDEATPVRVTPLSIGVPPRTTGDPAPPKPTPAAQDETTPVRVTPLSIGVPPRPTGDPAPAPPSAREPPSEDELVQVEFTETSGGANHPLGFSLSLAHDPERDVYFVVVRSVRPGSALSSAGVNPGAALETVDGRPLDVDAKVKAAFAHTDDAKVKAAISTSSAVSPISLSLHDDALAVFDAQLDALRKAPRPLRLGFRPDVLPPAAPAPRFGAHLSGQTPKNSARGIHEYDLSFSEHTIGMTLALAEPVPGMPPVIEVVEKDPVCEHASEVHLYDLLVAVNHRQLVVHSPREFQTKVLDVIRAAPRPLVLTFQPPHHATSPPVVPPAPPRSLF